MRGPSKSSTVPSPPWVNPGLAPIRLLWPIRCLLATIYGLMCVCYVPVWWVLGVIISPIPGLPHALVHWVIGIFLECFQIVFAIKIHVDGEEQIDPKQTYIIAGNHRSWLDALTLIVTFKVSKGNAGGRKLYFIVKRGLLFIPGFGLYLLWARYIWVSRAQDGGGRKADNNAKIDAAVQHLGAGKTILIFPEGTRAPDHRFLKFKRGAAEMALRSGKPVLPVVFSGTGYLYPKGKVFVRSGHVRAEVLPPIWPEGHTRESLTQAIYDAITERYRLTWDGPPAGDDDEVLRVIAPEHSRFRRLDEGAAEQPGSQT